MFNRRGSFEPMVQVGEGWTQLVGRPKLSPGHHFALGGVTFSAFCVAERGLTVADVERPAKGGTPISRRSVSEDRVGKT